jgi:hypothetical protein
LIPVRQTRLIHITATGVTAEISRPLPM